MRPLTISLLAATTLTVSALTIKQAQAPIHNDLGPAMPPSTSAPSTTTPPGDSNTVILSDVLGNSRSINIFAGFTRDFAPISQRFEDSKLNTTILAPVNSAIMALPRKPWENPDDYGRLGEQAYEGERGEERAKGNMRRFVEAHVVPVSPWREGEKVETLDGGTVWWESRDGIKFIQPGNIEVSEVASKVYNGELWILKGVRNYV